MSTTTIDCTGLNCPLPILRLSKAINGLGLGERLELIATDPGAQKDVAAWSRQTGNALLESREEGGRYVFLIERAS